MSPSDAILEPRARRRWTIEERFWGFLSDPQQTVNWCVSSDLFGDVGADINDFEGYNYSYFLDQVRSLEDFITGLADLSPLADDALDIAEVMSGADFLEFKICLAHERGQAAMGNFGFSRMPARFLPLLVPRLFIKGAHLAATFGVPLGAAVIRILTAEDDPEQGRFKF